MSKIEQPRRTEMLLLCAILATQRFQPEASMKHIAMTVLMVTLGVAGINAQQHRPLKMTFSGTNVATTINLQAGTVTDETQLAGQGTLGAFTFRELHADGPSPQPPASCFGPSFAVVTGAGVFRFQNGNLLNVTVVDGSGCVDLAAGHATLIVNYEVTGGTGRFADASGNLTMTATIAVVLRNAANAPALLTNTGEFEGMIFGAAVEEEDRQDNRR